MKKKGSTDVVTKQYGRRRKVNSKFMKKILNPLEFCRGISKGFVFSLCTGAGNSRLFFWSPREKIQTKKCAIAEGGFAVIRPALTTSLSSPDHEPTCFSEAVKSEPWRAVTPPFWDVRKNRN